MMLPCPGVIIYCKKKTFDKMTTQESNSETQKDGESSEQAAIPKTSSDHRLWIGNLDSRFREYRVNFDSISWMHSRLCTLTRVHLYVEDLSDKLSYFLILVQAINGQPRGYAFVTYKDIDDAAKAQKTLDGLEVFSRKLAVKWAHAQDETKFVNKTKAVPAILSISSKESSTCNTSKKLSKEKKIAALEEQLKMLEQKSGDMSFTPDVGVSSKPTSVIYNYIEQKPKTGISHGKLSGSHKYSSSSVRPYKKIRRK